MKPRTIHELPDFCVVRALRILARGDADVARQPAAKAVVAEARRRGLA